MNITLKDKSHNRTFYNIQPRVMLRQFDFGKDRAFFGKENPDLPGIRGRESAGRMAETDPMRKRMNILHETADIIVY